MTQLALMPDAVPSLDPGQGQWWTPPRLAAKIVDAFPIVGDIVEPSAGGGNLVSALTRRLGYIHAYETDARWIPHLRDRFPTGVAIHHRDVLTVDGGFEWCVMNPPDQSSAGVDVGDFLAWGLEHAMENVALIRTNVLHCEGRYEGVWKHAHIRALRFLVKRPAFSASGGQQEWCVVHYGASLSRAPITIEHWSEAWS